MIVASNQATTLKSFAQQTRANGTGRRTDCHRNLAKAGALFSQPHHLVATDYPARPSQRLPFELRVPQPRPDSLLNQRTFKFCHCADDLKHEPPRRRGEVQIVTEADKSNTVAVKVCESVDEVLERAPESVHLPAKHYVKAPQVNV